MKILSFEKKSFLALLITILVNTTITAAPKKPAEWTILSYIQADNNLAPFAAQNVESMQKAPLNSQINILIQWIQPMSKKIWRYKIAHKQKIEHESLDFAPEPNAERDVVQAMQWAHTNYPAKHYMLVLWNHGTGIVDKTGYRIRTRSLSEIPWLEIPGLAIHENRGILYSDTTHTYMTNQQLAAAFKTISHNIIGQKIDIVGMDACCMAMLEIAYQIKDYAKILVGSQNSEPGRGWDYGGFLKPLAENTAKFTPQTLVQQIVSSYEISYQSINFYTQSAIDLSCIDGLKKNLDNILVRLKQCDHFKEASMMHAIRKAHALSVKFDSYDFIDLCSFYSNLLRVTQQKKQPLQCTNASASYDDALYALHKALNLGIKKIKQSVIANSTGRIFKQAHGISIYFPQKYIHSSYPKTLFAQESQWMNLLETLMPVN